MRGLLLLGLIVSGTPAWGQAPDLVAVCRGNEIRQLGEQSSAERPVPVEALAAAMQRAEAACQRVSLDEAQPPAVRAEAHLYLARLAMPEVMLPVSLLHAPFLAHLGEAIRLDPAAADALLLRAEWHVARRQLDQAAADLDAAVARAPSSQAVLRARYFFRMRWRFAEGVVGDAERLVQLDANQAENHVLLGQAQLTAGNLARAGEALAQALRLEPANRLALTYRCVLKVRQRQDGMADCDAAMATTPEPEQPYALEMRAAARLAAGDRSGGRQDGLRALDMPGAEPALARQMLFNRWTYVTVADAGPSNAAREDRNRIDIYVEQLFGIRPQR